MASITESMALSCSSRFGISVSPRATVAFSSGVSLSARRRLPEFKGLKIQAPLKSTSASFKSRNLGIVNRRGGIVCQAQETAFDIPTVTDTTWQSLVLKADGPVLVEFWAPWCGPCRMIHPVIGELAQQYTGKLKCFKLNTDDSPSIATQYGIRSIPTMMIFINGEKKDAIIGAVPKSTLTACIDKFL
ncbi:hypothetical protein SLA2020_413020 [Shorea laevis]